MEGTIGEIRLFASNFAPRTWAYCAGQTVALRSNVALYSILGTTYGGDGTNTFMLPDLQGRVAVGTGQGAGLSAYSLGEKTGTETVTLTINEMPAHTHAAMAQPGIGASANVNLLAVNSSGGASTPGGNFIGEDSSGQGFTSYASSGTPAAMDPRSIQIANVQANVNTMIVQLGGTGSNQPHNNLQPYTALNYVICMNGVFPYRD